MSGLPSRGYLKRTEAQSLVAATRQNATMLAGAGARVTVYPNGTLVEMPRSRVAGRRGSNAPRTFFCTKSGADEVAVSPGVLNNTVYVGGTLTGLANGDKIYIEATVTSGTDAVTAVTVAKAASVPADTLTKGHTVIASVVVAEEVMTVIPLAWNYSQLQKCGSFRWGGFGS